MVCETSVKGQTNNTRKKEKKLAARKIKISRRQTSQENCQIIVGGKTKTSQKGGPSETSSQRFGQNKRLEKGRTQIHLMIITKLKGEGGKQQRPQKNGKEGGAGRRFLEGHLDQNQNHTRKKWELQIYESERLRQVRRSGTRAHLEQQEKGKGENF